MLLAFPFQRYFLLILSAFLVLPTATAQVCYAPGADTVKVSGELKMWHKITLSFDGPYARENCTPNPFFDYRLNVTFTHAASGKSYLIPGYFAADGNAAETSADSGHIWRSHFAPDETGTWTWVASFRQGAGIAIDPDSTAGAATDFDGLSGSFAVTPTDKLAPDMRARGRLNYVGERYLRFAGTGEYFVKAGADAPENFLAYDDFDNTPDNGGRRKDWAPHIADWNPGDPEWQGGKGHGIIGAINYLASEGMNVFSFLVNNIAGDDDNVFPFIAYNDQPSPQDDRLRYDVSKMDQWEIVFEHGEHKGMYLHFKLCETENDQLLDGGYLGNERKLFFREMMARYGHHNALNWNMGEENDLWDELNDPQNLVLISWMKHFHKYDPYAHHVVAHSYPQQKTELYTPLLGIDSAITGASVQTGWHQVHEHTMDWLQASQDSGWVWVVCNDEQGSAYQGVPPYNGYQGFVKPGNCPSHDDIRHRTVWGNLMAGGGGVEFYFGYSLPQDDLHCEDWRSRDTMWDYARHAISFFRDHIPFWEMEPDDNLVSHGYCFKKDGEIYVWYKDNTAQTSFIQLPAGETFEMFWYDPRNGGALLQDQLVNGGGNWYQPAPPSATGEDWVLLFINSNQLLPVELTSFEADAQGPLVNLTWETSLEENTNRFLIERASPGKAFVTIGDVPALGTGNSYQLADSLLATGKYLYRLRIVDHDGSATMSEVREVEWHGATWAIYPQPAIDILNIRLGDDFPEEEVTLRILSLNGQVLKETTDQSGQAVIVVPLGDLPAGSYLIEARSGRKILREPFVKGE